MIKVNHYIGGILLISGTSIGAGMLALPVMTALMGFLPSLAVFAICWLTMLATAIFYLDVNLAAPGEPNLISMAEKTLGGWGKALSWIVYLLLLYALLAAYIAGSGPLFYEAIYALTGFKLPIWVSPFLLPILFGGFIAYRTEKVDLVNRLLMIGLIVSFGLLISFVPSHIEAQNLAHVDMTPFVLGFPVAITAFGYHIIIPTLTTYMHHDRKTLKKTIIIGSLIPLVFYIIWQVLVLGAVPVDGLIDAYKEGALSTAPLTRVVKSPALSLVAKFFSFFAITTSFLGVAISLRDFLSDGFKIKKGVKGKSLAILLTFIPPLFFVLTYKRGFIVALEYAGAFVAILLIFLPAVMAWKLKKPKFYQAPFAKTLIIVLICIAFGIVMIDVLEQFGLLEGLVSRYVSA